MASLAFAYPVCTPETTRQVLRAFVKKHPRNSTNHLLIAEIERLKAEQAT